MFRTNRKSKLLCASCLIMAIILLASGSVATANTPGASADIKYWVVEEGSIYTYTLDVENTSTGTYDIYALLFGHQYLVPYPDPSNPLLFCDVVMVSVPRGWSGLVSPSYGFIMYSTNWAGSSKKSGYISPGESARFVFTSTTPPQETYLFGVCFYNNVNTWGFAYGDTAIKQTQVEDIQDLISEVEDLDLPNGLGNSIIKLQNAIDSLIRGNDQAAIQQLVSFIKQVETQRGIQISDDQADILISIAQAIIDSI